MLEALTPRLTRENIDSGYSSDHAVTYSYVRTYIHTYMHTYIHAYILSLIYHLYIIYKNTEVVAGDYTAQ